MAELPDLDTTEVGILGYWNALDDGAEEVDPTEVVDWDRLSTYGQYDNGVVGSAMGESTVVFQDESWDWREVNFRVKTDGWILAWLDRTNEFAKDLKRGDDEKPSGYYDLIYPWTYPRQDDIRLPESTLSHVISRLGELTTPNEHTPDEVGYYSYEYPDADQITTVTQYETELETDAELELVSGVGYADGSTRHYHAVVGSTTDGDGDDGSYGFDLSYAGEEFVSRPSDTYFKYGCMDALAENLVPDDEVLYDNKIKGQTAESSDGAKISHLILCEV